MNADELVVYLHSVGLLEDDDPVRAQVTVTPLSGGVSSDIRLVTTPTRQFVVKAALEKLRVQDDWYADLSRNDYEQAFLRYVGEIVPDAVPAILHSDPAAGLFVMEYLDGYANWKSRLLAGEVDAGIAAQAGTILGQIHRTSWLDEAAATTFDSTQNFFELRLDPYLLTTAKRHPALAPQLQAESTRIAATRLCLVHGDYSPKNMLIGHGQLVLLDCEVAWYGEPAFDSAFLLNHFLLKSLNTGGDPDPYLALIPAFWARYRGELGEENDDKLEARVVRLLPMLFLARIDGKSPVEYIVEPEKKDLVRAFAAKAIEHPYGALEDLVAAWRTVLHSNRAT